MVLRWRRGDDREVSSAVGRGGEVRGGLLTVRMRKGKGRGREREREGSGGGRAYWLRG